jgi:CHAT domain-containing protein
MPAEPAAPGTGAPVVPLSLAASRALVEHYRRQVADREFRTARGIVVKSRDPALPLPAQRPELLGDILLPAAVRARLRTLRPECLIVIPDGPLHKLPLEALPIEAGDKPRYLLDELPPTVYAPSATILTLLAERRGRDDSQPLSLLTVSDPQYSQKGGRAPEDARSDEQLRLLELVRALPPLPGTAAESAAVRRHFDAGRVKELRGALATKAEVLAHLPGRHIVHLAAHGFVDERFGNLFGALALTPGRGPTPDDGFLSLHEINQLPLQQCELAVLSACVTNVGPQRPLEAGVTLANGFLAAGARRVVASQWSVDDDATAVLMETYFAEVTRAAKAGERVSYAGALHRARLEVRGRPGWSAPFYWAPFVLLGPPE